MGRIKTAQVKRVTHKLMELYGSEFSGNFENNKGIVKEHISTNSKKLKNVIAGYITRLGRKREKPQK